MAAGCSHSGRSFCICNLGRKDSFWPWVPLVMCRTIKVITKYKRSFKSYVIYQVHVQKVKFSLMTNLTKKSLEKYWKSISQFSESDSHLFNWRSATCGHNNSAVPAPTHPLQQLLLRLPHIFGGPYVEFCAKSSVFRLKPIKFSVGPANSTFNVCSPKITANAQW